MSSSKKKDVIKDLMAFHNKRIKENMDREGLDKDKVEKYFQEMVAENWAFWTLREKLIEDE